LLGLDVIYDRLIPKDLGLTFNEVFDQVQAASFRRINVTYPYKELVTRSVTVTDPLVHGIGVVNTVVFEADGAFGFNTDYTGFVSAYQTILGDAEAGTVCLIGAGGMGKAAAFGLISLEAKCIRCLDLDQTKAEDLATSLSALGASCTIETHSNPTEAAKGADGIINCTPLGMVGIGGTPLAKEHMIGGKWAFDAVYTPVETRFLQDAISAELTVISGYTLFFGQGVDAWKIFSGRDADQTALRAAIRGFEP
jgi:shikimate dehydrogenase